MRQLSKSEIMHYELEMLIEFEKVCKENNLYYTLCGGTLLGAIRHKGFIPWDDDIDVMMPRPDFDKLCALIRKDSIKLPSHLRFVSWFTYPDMDIPFVKMVDKRTHVTEKYMDNDKQLWIDILVIDGCPEEDDILKKMFKRSIKLRHMLFNKQTKPGSGTTKAKAFVKDMIRFVLKPINSKHLCEKLEMLSKTYSFEQCKRIGCIQWGYGPQERVDKEQWLKPIEVEFEGVKFLAPSNYDEYLGNLYGDYMQLPPEEKRTSHDMIVEIEE